MPDRDFIVTGERAALGMLRREHLPLLASWFNDPEVRRGLAHRGVVNVEAEEKWFETMTEAGGIYLGRRRGEGIGSDAARLALGWGFEILGLRNVMLEAFDFNEAALRAYERAGFEVIGRRRDAVRALGRRCDVILMDAVPGS